MFPAAKFYKRRNYLLPQIFEFCKNRGYTDVIVVHERAKRPGTLHERVFSFDILHFFS